MEEIKNDLKNVALDIIQSNQNHYNDWLDKTARLYEKLLVLKYLDERDESLKGIRKNVQNELENIVSKPIKTEDIQDFQGLKSIQSEVRVVPHPEGPPIDKSKSEVPEKIAVKPIEKKHLKKSSPDKNVRQSIAEKAVSTKKKSLNEQLANKSLTFGLNDRIAFVKHLFNGSQEDFNRVVSQLNSFENHEETEQFIDHIVKPEYSWAGKEEFEKRFMEIVNARFE